MAADRNIIKSTGFQMQFGDNRGKQEMHAANANEP